MCVGSEVPETPTRRPPRPLAAPGPSSPRPQAPCSAPRASSGLAGSLPAAPGGGARGRSPLPRARRGSPAEPGGTRRRRSCGPDCSSGPPASRSCCRGPWPEATPGGRRPGTSRPRGKRPAPLPCPAAGALPAWRERGGAEGRPGAAGSRGSGLRSRALSARGAAQGIRTKRQQLVLWEGVRSVPLAGAVLIGTWRGQRSRRWVSPSETALERGPLAREARDVPPGLRTSWLSFANVPVDLPWQCLASPAARAGAGGFPGVQALRMPWTLEPLESLWVVSVSSACVCTRAGVGCLPLCSLRIDAALPSCLLPAEAGPPRAERMCA